MSAPALTSGGGRVVAYDVGGTELFVLDGNGVLLEQTTEEPNRCRKSQRQRNACADN